VAPWHEAPNVHPYWGPWHQILTGYSTDEEVRHRASSGAGITALALHALRSGLVDKVIQTAADPQRPTRNMMVVSRTAEEVIHASGSRYAASSPLEDIDRALNEEGRIAFIGKPCDASALRQFGKFDARVGEKIPLVLAFFCAGIPSEAGAENILAAFDMAGEELAEFRYRGHGWPGHAVATTTDGRSAKMTYAESWGGHLSKEVQFRCKICPDAVGGVADIACADAWYGGESGYPSFEEEKGRSLIVTRTEAGDRFLHEAVQAGALAVETLPLNDIDMMQPSQVRRKRLIKARTLATRMMLQPVPRMDGLLVKEASRKAGSKEALHNFLGTARRIFTGKR
jgi:coenzyme F420 hydrogenase subunit beta